MSCKFSPQLDFQIFIHVYDFFSLCLAVIVALPAATPKELKNSASFALGNFTNCMSLLRVLLSFGSNCFFHLVNGWTPGYAFILSFLAPLWTICDI